MVHMCAVVGCGNKSRGLGLSFYRFPAVNERFNDTTRELQLRRRQAWIAALRRADITEKKCLYSRVCSIHFVTGKPADLYDTDNADWTPSVQMGYQRKEYKSRVRRKQLIEFPENFPEDPTESLPEDSKVGLLLKSDPEDLENEIPLELAYPIQSISIDCSTQTCAYLTQSITVDCSTQTCEVGSRCVSVQTDLSGSMLTAVEEELMNSNFEKYELRAKLSGLELTEEHFKEQSKKLKFFTGLPSFELFLVLLSEISAFLNYTSVSRLTKFQQLLLTLMKLRLNLKFMDLGYRFRISNTTASRVFNSTLEVLYCNMPRVVAWPEREELQKTMPGVFQRAFGKSIAVIVDCFEISTQKPSSLTARNQNWPDYKGKNTVKYLIGITPQGVISFVSKGWSGQTSDEHVTENCGILENLLPGDTVIADRGFSVSREAEMYCASVKTTSSTKKKTDLQQLEIKETKKVASLRGHVGRVIGTVRQRFTILSGLIPIEMLDNKDESTLDKIVQVCCRLTNMCPTAVPLD